MTEITSTEQVHETKEQIVARSLDAINRLLGDCAQSGVADYKKLVALRCEVRLVRIAEPMTKTAMECGYALAWHGSLARDIDVVAVPWTEESLSAEELVDRLIKTLLECNNGMAFLNPDRKDFKDGVWGMKPHGRRCWSIHLGGGPYIDLGVMPRQQDWRLDQPSES